MAMDDYPARYTRTGINPRAQSGSPVRARTVHRPFAMSPLGLPTGVLPQKIKKHWLLSSNRLENDIS